MEDCTIYIRRLNQTIDNLKSELKGKDAKIQLALKELAHIEGEKNPTEIRVEQALKEE